MLKLLASPLASTVLYALSVLTMRGISFVMLPFVAKSLSPAQFGELELLTTYAILGSVVISLGLEHALYRFCGQTQHQDQRQKIASLIYSLCLMIGAVVFITSLLVANAALLPWVFCVIGMTLALETLISVPLGWLRMNNRSVAFCFASVLRAALQAILLIFFLNAGRGIAGVFEASFIAAALTAILLYAQNTKSLKFVLAKQDYLPFLKYGMPLVGSGLLAFFLSGLDRWLLAQETSLETLAHYAIAAKFALLVTLALQPFGMWFMPKRFEILNGVDGLAQSQRWATVGIHLCLFIALGVGLSAALFIHSFLPTSYAAAITLLPLCIAWACCKELAEYVNIGCFVGERTHQQLYINLIATVVGVTSMLMLVSPFGAQGILLGLFMAQLTRLSLFYGLGKRQVDLNLPVARIALLLTLVIALVYWQNHQTVQSLQQLLGQAVAGLALYSLVVITLFREHSQRLWLGLYSHLRGTPNEQPS